MFSFLDDAWNAGGGASASPSKFATLDSAHQGQPGPQGPQQPMPHLENPRQTLSDPHNAQFQAAQQQPSYQQHQQANYQQHQQANYQQQRSQPAHAQPDLRKVVASLQARLAEFQNFYKAQQRQWLVEKKCPLCTHDVKAAASKDRACKIGVSVLIALFVAVLITVIVLGTKVCPKQPAAPKTFNLKTV